MLSLTLLSGLSKNSYCQFYSGSQLSFGKNRVQYTDRFWSYIRFNKYDVYYYKDAKALAIWTANYAEQTLKQMQLKLAYNLDNKIQFIIFNKYSDLQQSNIGLIDEDQYNTGGITRITGSKVILYYNGDHKKLEEQIRYGIATIMLNEMIYGQSYFAMMKNSLLISFPLWYIEGLLAYLTKDWNSETENRVKDAIMHNKYKRFNDLENEDAVFAGHSIWKFIAYKYGEDKIPEIIFMAKINRNIETGFLYVLGLSFNKLIYEWYDFYFNYKYYPLTKKTEEPAKNYICKTKPATLKKLYQAKISPDDNYVAYITNKIGLYKVILFNQQTGKKKCILKRGVKLDEKTDYSYPLLAWHPSGSLLAIIYEAKGKTWLYFYNIQNKERDKRPIYHFEKILDFSYNNKGDKFVLSAIQKGHSDIFVYSIASNTFQNITQDLYDDSEPCFMNNSEYIVFTSNRNNDTIKFYSEQQKENFTEVQQNKDIFLYDYKKKKNILLKITDSPDINESQPYPTAANKLVWLSDANGIINRYEGKIDSTIAFVDTTIHYRYYTKVKALSNYMYNINEHNYNTKAEKYTEIIYNEGAYKLFIKSKASHKYLDSLDNYNSYPKSSVNNNLRLKKEQNQGNIIEETPHKRFVSVFKEKEISKDSNQVNIDDYIFDTEKNDKKTIVSGQQPTISSQQSKFNIQNSNLLIPRAQNANTEYGISEIVTQIDFSYLNTSYQPFSGGSSPIFINPGLNAFFKLGVTDLFEDYRIIGGLRLSPANLSNNEYVVSFGNYKKRLDRELVYHRASLVENATDYLIIKHHSNQLYYILNYPFNQALSIKSSIFARDDKSVYMSTESKYLKAPDVHKLWGGIKEELSFDNTRSKGTNLYIGTRYKFFCEYFRLLNDKNQELFVLGFDYRRYIKIHRTFIWANRFATSTSLGPNKLIYYMGGVDTWLKPQFDQTINVSDKLNYIYQTLATNMRGFKQNIRNGNSFALVNSELRFPAFKYLINKPIKSEIINNFQVIAFTDVGTAWTGTNPFSEKNSLYTQTVERFPIKVTIKNQKDPIVAGYGFGLRTTLFGYFIRADWAWGVEDREIQKMQFYLSLSLDF